MRKTGEQDLLRSQLGQIIDMDHPLGKLGRTVDWAFLEREFGAVTRMIRAARHCRRD